MKKCSLIFFVIIIMISLTQTIGFCDTDISQILSPLSHQLVNVQDIKQHKFETKRAVLVVQDNYLNNQEIQDIGKCIDKGIEAIEKYTGIGFDKTYYQHDKISYFIRDGQFISYAAIGNTPAVMLAQVKEHEAPYIHESVHVITKYNPNSMAISEGLAVFFNDKLGGYKTFPNYGENIDLLAKKYVNDIKYQPALEMIDREGLFPFSDSNQRKVFYILSGSFVKYLISQIEIKQFMKIYQSQDILTVLEDETGNDISAWKNQWIKSLE